MSYMKTAYAHGQADALAALGIKQANFFGNVAQKARTLFGNAAHAGEAQLGHSLPHGVPHGVPQPVSGVRLTTPEDLIPQAVKDLGAQGRTIAGEAVDHGQEFAARLPARPRPVPTTPGAAVKVNPTRDVGSQVGSLSQIGSGQRPVGNAHTLDALSSLNSGGVESMTGSMAAAPVGAAHSGAAFTPPEVLQEREKWHSLKSIFDDIDAGGGAPGSQVGSVPTPPVTVPLVPQQSGYVNVGNWASEL